jgi:hypothetical protein
MKSTIVKAGYKALRPKAADPLNDFLNSFALPPAENAARTQIIGTLPTYQKASDEFMRRGMQGRGLDYGAGLGKGAEVMPGQYETYEPFAKGWNPTYSKPQDIPSDAYNRLTNLNVLNVVPREARDEIVTDIGRVMEPGGMGIITTRGADVMKAAGRQGPEPMSIITSRDTYQKGFRPDELQEYLRYMLGDRFEIDRLNLGPAGATIRKKAEGGLAELAGGGQSAKMLQQVYRGFAGKPGKEEIFASPQRRVADYYAAKRAAQTGEAPGVEALLVDPFAGKQYGHALPIDRFNKDFVTTQARKLSPLDVIDSRIIENAKVVNKGIKSGDQTLKHIINSDPKREAIQNDKMINYIKNRNFSEKTIEPNKLPTLDDIYAIDKDPYDRVLMPDERKVKAYKERLLSGSNPPAIVMDEQGNILDGQHRAIASREAGLPIKAYVANPLLSKAKGGSTTPAWQRKEGKNPEGGLNAKGRASYKAETGGTLKRPQPEGGARRDSFCARMKGMKKKLTSAKTANDPDSRINKSLRKWNC